MLDNKQAAPVIRTVRFLLNSHVYACVLPTLRLLSGLGLPCPLTPLCPGAVAVGLGVEV